MGKKKSKTANIEEQLTNALVSGWCVVNTDNRFIFDSNDYVIDAGVKQYVVLNKAKKENGKLNDYTNEASMSSVLAIDNGEEIRFYDENFTEVNTDLVKLL